MSNLAMKTNADEEFRALEALIPGFLKTFSHIGNKVALQKLGMDFIKRFPPEKALEIASYLSYANPFFMPEIPDEFAVNVEIGLDVFSEYVMRAKLGIRHTRQPNILLACAPKSASTFIQSALVKALALPTANLFTATMDGSSATELGASLNEQEPDELAMIRAGLNRQGYVAQHHARCSPYMARMLDMYKVTSFVSYRNIFDTLISLDDMVMASRIAANDGDRVFLFDGLPSDYEKLERDDRLMLLAQRMTAWLTQFYVSWRKCEQFGLVRPLWISYEEDFLGDKRALGMRIAEYLGAPADIADKLGNAFGETPETNVNRFNKGVAGRGKEMPGRVRDTILKTALRYADDVDLSPLVGQANA